VIGFWDISCKYFGKWLMQYWTLLLVGFEVLIVDVMKHSLYLLGYTAVKSVGSQLMFQMIMSVPSSSKSSKKRAIGGKIC
jgi:hypothetical protein